MKKIILIIASGWSILCNAQEASRPRDLWVYRSVLDKQPRVITVFLNTKLQVAYDGTNCGVFKTIKDGVRFEGTIWDTRHGPQPLSIGKPYQEGIVNEQVWFIYKDGIPVPTQVQFKGYVWKNNKVTFNYQLTSNDNVVAKVEETPEYVTKPDGKSGLERKFTISGLPASYSAVLKIVSGGLDSKEDFIFDGEFKLDSKIEDNTSAGTVLNYKGRLIFSQNKSFTVKTFFSPKLFI